jgi:alpha-galactosidase
VRRAWISFFAIATLAGGTDLAGTWRFEQTSNNGRKRIITYVFRPAAPANVAARTDPGGGKFTGDFATLTERREILNGVIDGNKITFETHFEFDDPGRVTPFTGEINGDELKITPARPPTSGRPPQVTTLRRVSNATTYTPPPEAMPLHKPLPPFQAIPPNGLALTPPMGWNSWNKFAGRIDDKAVREIADAMVASGMRDAGYVYVNIDDTWEGERAADGSLQTNAKFPDMKALADYVHSKGLKIGIYSGPGYKTCAGFEGSYMHEEQDARTWAAWGIDYLKYDWCSASAVYHRDDMAPAYKKMALALRATKRPIIFSLCQYGWLNVGEWGAAAGGNLWRTTGDISDRWESMSRIGFGQNGREKFAGPGHWNDPDMLEIGNGGMTDTEYRTHMSLWSMLAAPLLAGHDVRVMTEAAREILNNREVIAIDQDKLGRQGFRMRQDGELEVWKKPLADGVAVGLFNRSAAAAQIKVTWAELGIDKTNPIVRDLWAHKDVQSPQEFSAEVPSHGVVMLKVK